MVNKRGAAVIGELATAQVPRRGCPAQGRAWRV